jgi:hypothetical protein
MSKPSTSSEQIDERAKDLARHSPNTLLAYLVALQEQLLYKVDSLASQLAATSQTVQPLGSQHAPTPAISKPIKYEYTTVTIRSSILGSEDKRVNKKTEEMSSQGWELVSNTVARGTLLEQSGRMLQFRRPKRG